MGIKSIIISHTRRENMAISKISVPKQSNHKKLGSVAINNSDAEYDLEIELSDDIRTYQFLMLSIGYYNSGMPSYGQIIIPTSLYGRIAEKISSLDVGGKEFSLTAYYDATYKKVKVSHASGAMGNYITVFGIQV